MATSGPEQSTNNPAIDAPQTNSNETNKSGRLIKIAKRTFGKGKEGAQYIVEKGKQGAQYIVEKGKQGAQGIRNVATKSNATAVLVGSSVVGAVTLSVFGAETYYEVKDPGSLRDNIAAFGANSLFGGAAGLVLKKIANVSFNKAKSYMTSNKTTQNDSIDNDFSKTIIVDSNKDTQNDNDNIDSYSDPHDAARTPGGPAEKRGHVALEGVAEKEDETPSKVIRTSSEKETPAATQSNVAQPEAEMDIIQSKNPPIINSAQVHSAQGTKQSSDTLSQGKNKKKPSARQSGVHTRRSTRKK